MIVPSGALIRHLLSIFFLISLLTLAHGEIRESKDSIVDSKMHKSLDLLEEQLGFDNTELPKGHAIAAVSLSGCNLGITIVGPVEGKALDYARLIDGWRAKHGLTGDVLWSQEDDSASAKYSYRPGHIGSTKAMTEVNLDDLRNVLLRAESKTQIVFGEPAWSKNSVEMPTTWIAPNGYRYWNLSVPTHPLGIVYGSIAIPSILVILLILWFFLIPVGILIAFLLGNREGRRTDIPLAERRRRYGQIVTGGSFGILGVHMVIVISTITTRTMEPLSQLWFGERFTTVAIPFLMLGMFAPMALLPLQNRAERRLMGPSEDEKRLQTVQPPLRVIPQPPSKIKGWATAVLVLCVVSRVCLVPLGNKSDIASILNLVSTLGAVLAIIPILFAERNLPKLEIDPETLERLEAQLHIVVEKVAGWMSIAPPKSRVLREALYGRFAAVCDSKGVGVTIGAMEELLPEEIDFLVAHELAHQKLGHRRRMRWIIALPFLLMLIDVVCVAMGLKMSIVTPSFILTPIVVVPLLMLPFTVVIRKWRRTGEFDADRMAVETTGNPQAAISALRKITLNSTQPGIHDVDMSSHPAVNQRLQAIRLLG